MTAFVSPSDVVREGPADDAGRILYRVVLPQTSYLGQVLVDIDRAAAGGAEAWIARRLEELAGRIGAGVLQGRAYSPFVID